MKRNLLLLVLVLLLTNTVNAQLITYSKTLPNRSYSIGVAPVMNASSIAHPSITVGDPTPLSGVVFFNYSLKYDVDISFSYGQYLPDKDAFPNAIGSYFAADVQYMFRETRKSYYSLYGGAHYWEALGIDMAFSYTHMLSREASLSAGLDIEFDFAGTNRLYTGGADPYGPVAWIPVNFGYNVDDRVFFFFEYDLPATTPAWDRVFLGVNFIIR